jgi:2-C-methyl-D-erythritol 2,4-cyclodiphosphate synthase
MVEYRTGIGWDSHRIEAGRPLILGGVRIEAEFGLAGHSDADVLSHAITDALLGATAQGDIGMHFPDSDPQWKGAGSLHFLHHAFQLTRLAGYELVNVDATIVLERPRLAAYRSAICRSLAEALGISIDRMSVKFKTAEGVGPAGEGKSAEAQAVVTVKRITGSI